LKSELPESYKVRKLVSTSSLFGLFRLFPPLFLDCVRSDTLNLQKGDLLIN